MREDDTLDMVGMHSDNHDAESGHGGAGAAQDERTAQDDKESKSTGLELHSIYRDSTINTMDMQENPLHGL